MTSEFKLPELGENILTGTLTGILVKDGESFKKDQVLLEIETDKAVIELPAENDGVMKKLLVQEGDSVNVGQVLFQYDEAGSSESAAPPAQAEPSIPEKEKKTPEAVAEKPAAYQPEQKSKAVPSVIEIVVPELGENIETGTVAGVLVRVGDTIENGQPLIELETDKAVVEIPSDVEGTVKEILVKEGEQVKVGQKIIVVSGEQIEKAETLEPSPVPAEASAVTSTEPAPAMMERAAASEPSAGPRAAAITPVPAKSPSEVAPAAPSVRRFAREIGIDINQVPGTGPGGRILVDDVKNYSKVLNRQRAAQSTVLQGFDAEPLPDFSRWGNIDVQPMGSVRQKTATHLSYAWATVPQVTQFEKADITDLEKLRKKYAHRAEAAGGKLTMTAILLKVCEAALKLFPQFNSSIDMRNKQVIYKQYYNIGVAVDTDRGLLVPVIKNIDHKNIIRISVELNQLAEKARTKKLSLDEMQGGNFSISNLGGIGGTAFTPIVNTPEVAILGVSRGKIEPVYSDGSFQPRMMLPLSLTYDHRIIDGADGIRFLRWIVEALENPFLLPLEG